MLYQQSSTEVGFQHNRSHALTRTTHLQFRKPMSVLKKRKMSIKYYHSYLIHLHKSPSTLSLFLVVPEIGRNTEVNQAAILRDSAQNIRSQIPPKQTPLGSSSSPTTALSPRRDYRTGHPHNLFSLLRGRVNSELKIL